MMHEEEVAAYKFVDVFVNLVRWDLAELFKKLAGWGGDVVV